MKMTNLLIAAFVTLLLTACISPKSYLDPSQPKIAYTDLKRPSKPIPLKLTTEFQRNGEAYPKANATLLDNTSRILRASGVIEPDGQNSLGTIHVTVNNLADIASAASKGFGTGLTFGLVGSTVADNYELTMSIALRDKTITKNGIRNGIATAIGNTSIPPGVETFTPSLAFQKVLEQMLLEALKQIQTDESLTKTTTIVVSGNKKQKIEELQGLYKEGLISDKEFQIKRKTILTD